MLAVASGLWAQTHEVTPLTLAQGDVIHVHGSLRDRTARMNERTIRLFPQTDGTTLGLRPVPVNDRTRMAASSRSQYFADSRHIFGQPSSRKSPGCDA